MIISHKYKFIFIKTAKTAGTSIEAYLSPICDSKDVFTPFSRPEKGHEPRNYRGWFNPLPEILIKAWHRDASTGMGLRSTMYDFLSRRKFTHHTPAWRIRLRIPEAMWRNYFKFCVERNPWDKIVSGWHWYRFKYGVEVTMDEYLAFCTRRIRLRTHGTGICPYNILNYTDLRTGEVLADRIVRYESLDEELNEIFSQLKISFSPPLSVRAKSGLRSSKDYRGYFTVDQRGMVEELFRDEITLHHYSY